MQTAIKTAISTPLSEQSTAYAVAKQYVVTQLDPAFDIVNGVCSYSKPHGRQIWSFIIRCHAGPLMPIYIDSQTNQVITFTDHEIQTIREKAIIQQSRVAGLLPVDGHGHIVREYARLQADGYLAMHVGLQVIATDGVFVPLECPIWQFLIEVRLPKSGTIGVFGMIDVNARTGEITSLTQEQIQKLWSRASATAELQTSPTTR